MDSILKIENLQKKYKHIQAVADVSFEVKKGSIFGLLGPNGSGKTTILGIVLNVLNRDHGNYYWFGEAPLKGNRGRIGAILEHPNFYPYLSAEKNLEVVVGIKQVSKDNIERVLRIVELFDRRKDKFSTFSLGMKQRLAIAAALISKPEVLVLDEPTNGLDPQGIVEIRELILKIASMGTTIIISSHLLDEIEKICTDVVILKNGRLLLAGKVGEINKKSSVIEVAADDMGKLYDVLENYQYTRLIEADNDKFLVSFTHPISCGVLNNFLLTERKISLTHLVQKRETLENRFMELISESK
ncbi:ABC transporter ATP-binding protein [Pedobacter lusitanus]|uniref:ABC transporter ATP-binding protein n=1 Tax=Pedobacter lusitanus TaxID=1503925 RepID=A0A0D0GKI9_9SPHI|nr:ATP-binding cassette domain-containing protein [Pedobacter lusitanus]KIO74901.1 ABC transporter ATP-binding protein [Pedobacter lusitanus]